MRRAATAPRLRATDRPTHHRRLHPASTAAVATRADAAEPSPTGTTGAPAPRAKGVKLPAFDYTALVASVCEVRALGVPTKVELAAQADAYTLVLGLRGIDGNVALHVSWHPDAARVCLGPPPPRIHKTEQLSFGEQCHALLRNLVLTRAALPEPWERVATFSFADRPGDEPRFTLHCEVMGRNSNAVLVDDATGKIAACAYQVGAAQTSVRPLSPGFEYRPPPPAPGVAPNDAPALAEWRDIVTRAAALPTPGVEKGMVRAFRGVSPALAATLLAGSGANVGSSDPSPSALTDDAWRALHEEWRRWVDALTGAVDAPADPIGAGLTPLSAASRAADPAGAGGPVGALFAEVYGGAGDADVFRREKDRLLQAVGAAVKKNRQKVNSFRKQIAEAEAHEDVKTRADEIMAYQHGYQQGASALTVYDFETGEAKEIPIDALKGPVAAAEALYKKARKQRRTAGAVEPLLEAASREAEYLEQVEFSLRELTGQGGKDDVLALEEIDAELGKRGATPSKPKKKGGRDDPMINIRRYVAPSGKEVLVGRNSRGNEAVSLSIGKDQDVWFHVRGAPGAHVILRQQPGQEASDEDLQYAADLAAFHSKLRTGGKVDVSFTSPKFVRKPSGGRLGMVTIDKERVMLGMPDASEAAAEEERDRAAGKKTASSW
ncbi:predicted protein [Micromonas commoda]|uniref:NFACT RNA-binding domain-containing protein n=1 Tax=Micromonas commoda (strain RCC299 / NOUM17 / CCMP2709) TaxID=296587 RepID=C1E8J9_MICCC|nr:predicted protein [Micromonas commoda]ACO64165.1 predicted protein [Micromonas commoda]|eukprot:XP_002502907.1 predicted protein [Micromonas commoda]